MTQDQYRTLLRMAANARPITDDDWGSERQVEAFNAFTVFVSDDLGVDTEDLATAKAGVEELVDENLRRGEQQRVREMLTELTAAGAQRSLLEDWLLVSALIEAWLPFNPRPVPQGVVMEPTGKCLRLKITGLHMLHPITLDVTGRGNVAETFDMRRHGAQVAEQLAVPFHDETCP
jgi:hypothetical protein